MAIIKNNYAYAWFIDDITFCASECDHTECFRHRSNVKYPKYPHSVGYLKGTELCCLEVADEQVKSLLP